MFFAGFYIGERLLKIAAFERPVRAVKYKVCWTAAIHRVMSVGDSSEGILCLLRDRNTAFCVKGIIAVCLGNEHISLTVLFDQAIIKNGSPLLFFRAGKRFLHQTLKRSSSETVDRKTRIRDLCIGLAVNSDSASHDVACHAERMDDQQQKDDGNIFFQEKTIFFKIFPFFDKIYPNYFKSSV